jgi:hypothetical protein
MTDDAAPRVVDRDELYERLADDDLASTGEPLGDIEARLARLKEELGASGLV